MDDEGTLDHATQTDSHRRASLHVNPASAFTSDEIHHLKVAPIRRKDLHWVIRALLKASEPKALWLTMPFERFDGHRRGASQSASFYARSAQHLRRYRYPFLAIIAGLSAFTLYQHSYSERHAYQSPSTNLGWQSFLPAYVAWTPDSSPSPSPSDDPASSSLQPGTGGTNGGNDWLSDFDDPQYNDAYDGFAPTQSTEQWDPFTLNPRPLVEITAKSCIWPPSVYDSCMPESSMREDAERGKWLRVEKDLNLRIGVCESTCLLEA